MTKRGRGQRSRVQNNGASTGGVTGKGFIPGESGNPGGRPKDDPELIAAFRDRTMKAVATLDKAMDDFARNAVTEKGDPLVPAAAAVKAAEVTLNRGWGSAPQTIKLDAKLAADVMLDARPDSTATERMQTLAVLLKANAFEQLEAKTETAEPVENKETA